MSRGALITPLMTQYRKVKDRYPDAVVLFRMGDFYETFEDDAKIASSVLSLTLTKRSNGAAADVPLAGFPHHAINQYLPKLVKAGYRVAVCEQLEDPKLAKGIVKRDIVEVVTPGVNFSGDSAGTNNYFASIISDGTRFGLAFCEASGPCLIRTEGNDESLIADAVGCAESVSAGHTFYLVIKDAFPINVLNQIKSCQEVVSIFAATANPLQLVVATTDQGKGVLGVIDGFSPKGTETDSDRQERRELLRRFGYKL